MQLAVESLSKNISGKAVLNHINFDWQPGEIIGLVGRNGAGKSTLMRTMMNQYLPDAGTISIDGENFKDHPEQRSNLIFVDSPFVFFKRMTLTQIADYYALAYPTFDRRRFEKLADNYNLDLYTQYRALSKGYEALVAMIIALASNAPFILLDEPFDGLDLFIRETIIQLIIDEVADGQRGFLIASHNLDELDGLADRILFLKHASISKDVNLEEARQSAMKIQMVFPGSEIPDVVRESGCVLNVSGRVIEVLFNDYSQELEDALQAEHPVLFETLPLSLTDLFKGEFRKRGVK